MAKTNQRIFAMVAAVVFFSTSVGSAVLVLQQMRKDSKLRDQQSALQSGESGLESESKDKSTTNQDNGGTKLQGTKLADFTALAAVDTLQTIDLIPGTGPEVQAGATVTAHYTGAIAKDGTIFESSKDSGRPATFPLSRVIAGWQQGVPGMKVGGTRRLIIPAALAYGEGGSPPKIGPNEPLVFDIEMVSTQ